MKNTFAIVMGCVTIVTTAMYAEEVSDILNSIRVNPSTFNSAEFRKQATVDPTSGLSGECNAAALKNDFAMNAQFFFVIVLLALCSCAPQREFVQFGQPGAFHPGPHHSGSQFSGPDGEYDSYELVDNGGVPNHGIAPMYSGGHQRGYGYRNPSPSISPDTPMYYDARQPGYEGYNNGGYPRAVNTYDQYGNRQTRIIQNPW